MKLAAIPVNRIITLCVLAAAATYALFYFNYFETPTGDYIGNIREPVMDYMKGNFPGQNYKFLPLYPLLLSFLTRLNPIQAFDRIYLTAMILNIVLFVPYIIIVLELYRRFLAEKIAWLALVFLSINIYTVYTAVNSELEMLLSLLAILSLYLSIQNSRISYLTAFLTAITKWDAVFIIPAVMFRDFFFHRRKILSIALGVAATSGIAAWLILSMINTAGHPYVSEIAHRGPNIYRFIIDCFLVSSGFIQWMAQQGYFSDVPAVKIFLLGCIVIPGLIIAAGIVWGTVLIIQRNRRELAPVLVFFFGYILIHLIYQNTKDRYVLPILWILNLFLFYGLSEGIIPWMKMIYEKFSDRTRKALRGIMLIATAIFFLAGIAAIAVENTIAHVLFASLFTALSAVIILYADRGKNRIDASLVILIAGIFINLMIFYGVHLMDHHSLSRVEFKKVALWYSKHAAASDRMLIAETNVPKYYSGFDEDKFIISYFIRGNTIEELIPELREKKATYVFVDDFYIRRLAYRDPNAVDRKAWIFREIRERGEETGHFRLVETFRTRGGITSYLYKFIP